MTFKMRFLFTLMLLINLTTVTKGQTINIDSCGLDNSGVLTKWEIEYFKKSIRTLQQLDIENKMFAFAYGNFGKTVIGKKDYFEMWGRDYYTRNSGVSSILIRLSEEEKILSGGYDYIIVSWSKTLPAGKSRKKLIERVKQYSEINLQ